MDESHIPILLKTNAILAVNKPIGVSVHNIEDQENILQRLEKQLQIQKLFPIHRLDKETSGVQIFAQTAVTARTLAAEFQNQSVSKTYIGLLRGGLDATTGQWRLALTDKSEGRKNPAGLSKDRVPCATDFRVLKSSKYFSLCEFDLMTGRQHQIRKHAALAGHAIVGDSRYGDRSYNERMQSLYKTDRMFLHCLNIKIAGHDIRAELPAIFESVFS